MKQRTKTWFFVLAALYSTGAMMAAENTKVWIQRSGAEIKSATISFGEILGEKEKKILALLESLSTREEITYAVTDASKNSCREIDDTRGADKRIATRNATRRHRSHQGTRTHAKQDTHRQTLRLQCLYNGH